MSASRARSDDLDAPSLEYVPIPIGTNGSVLLAHDRYRLARVLIHGLCPVRVLRLATPDQRTAGKVFVERVEAAAIQRICRDRDRWRAWQCAQLVGAFGLPFLVAALFGLVALPINHLPVVGTTLSGFFSSVGATLGGLPLAVAISISPSILLFRRVFRRSFASFKSSRTEAMLAISHLETREDVAQLLSEAKGVLNEIGGLMNDRLDIDGERALQLAAKFDQLRGLSARYGIVGVQVFASDLAAQLRRAGRPPRRLIPGLYARRTMVNMASMVEPYELAARGRRSGFVSVVAGLIMGVTLGVGCFIGAGIFFLRSNDALLVAPNEAVVFPSNASVFALGKGFDGPPAPIANTTNVVEGSGVFWAWPRPLTQRWLLHLADRSAPVTTAMPTGSEPEDIRVAFRYEVTDLEHFVVLAHPDFLDRFVSDALEVGFAQFLRVVRTSLVEQYGASDDARVNNELRSDMSEAVNRFISIANSDDQMSMLGISIQPDPAFSFKRV